MRATANHTSFSHSLLPRLSGTLWSKTMKWLKQLALTRLAGGLVGRPAADVSALQHTADRLHYELPSTAAKAYACWQTKHAVDGRNRTAAAAHIWQRHHSQQLAGRRAALGALGKVKEARAD